MSSNLLEFVKVFTMVFGTSSIILMLRSTFKSLTTSKYSDVKRIERANDITDYDGMGDHSRFPSPKGENT